MEPDAMPLHSSSSPPPLDGDGDEEAGSEEDEFGDFGGFSVVVSCSHPVYPTDSPSSLKRPCPTTKPAPRPPHRSFNHPVEQSQPTSTVDSGSGGGQRYAAGRDCDAGSRVRLTNGYPEGDPDSGSHAAASAAGARSPREETGFADFTVFTEQAAHPWCCGFTPAGSGERWDVRVEHSANGLGEQVGDDPGREVVLDSEPGSHCAKEKVKHREQGDAAQPSQDRRQSQEAAAAALEFGKPGDSRKERRCAFKPLQTAGEMQEDGESAEGRDESVPTLPQTVGVYESASEDLASFSDDLSFECPSADLEPNVSSLVSQEDQTDWDQTDDDNDDEEELGSFRCSDGGVADLRQSEAEKGFHYCDQSQETGATSNQPQPGTLTEDTCSDLKGCGSEHHGVRGRLRAADAATQSPGNLPPSDSFADFCSAPTQEEGDGSWAEFKDQSSVEERRTWTRSREPVSGLQTDGDPEEEEEEEQGGARQHGGSRRNSCQGSLSCRVQQLLLACFPEVEVPAVEGKKVLSLGALLHIRLLPESEEEEEEEEEDIPELCLRSKWIHQDLHDAVGLRFQWGGSHTDRTLLRCLGVETRNIVFLGIKKQPVAVPAFASSLGMLEPTKDSVPAVCPPGHTAVSAPSPPEPRDTPDPSTDVTQEALPSSQLAWSRRGLSSSQDGTSPRRAPHFWGWK